MVSILVVDDDANIRETLAFCFRDIGFQVELSRDGREAIEKYTAGQYDIVITDISMPRVDGRMVARHIRASDRKSPIIIGMSFSAMDDEEGLFDIFVQKPFTFTLLVNSIHELLVERGAIE